MKSKSLIGLFFIVLSTNGMAESNFVYLYKDKNGSTLLTNKEISSPDVKLLKSTEYKLDNSPDGKKYRDLTSGENSKSKAILDYKFWLDNGKIGLPPIIPDRVHNQAMFTPIISAVLMSGNGFIDSASVSLDYVYETHKDCMNDKVQNLSEAKKNYNFKFSERVKYPKDARLEYRYICQSEVLEVRNPVISRSELVNAVKFINEYEKKHNALPRQNKNASDRQSRKIIANADGTFSDVPTGSYSK